MLNVELKMEKYDSAMLNLAYARASLFCTACLVEAESCNMPNPQIIGEALHAVNQLLENATAELIC